MYKQGRQYCNHGVTGSIPNTSRACEMSSLQLLACGSTLTFPILLANLDNSNSNQRLQLPSDEHMRKNILRSGLISV